MKIRAVIFDLDGTLVDTLEDIVRCLNHCLKTMGEPCHSLDRVRMMVGDGVRTLCERALGTASQHRVDELLDAVRAYYRNAPVESAAPYPGIVEMVGRLKQAGLRLAVLTNKPETTAHPLVERLFEPRCFEEVAGYCAGRPLKPDPGYALEMAGKMEMHPGEILFVGDTEIDLKTGQAAGMPTLGVTWGFRSAEELKTRGARDLVDTPAEIVAWLGLR